MIVASANGFTQPAAGAFAYAAIGNMSAALIATPVVNAANATVSAAAFIDSPPPAAPPLSTTATGDTLLGSVPPTPIAGPSGGFGTGNIVNVFGPGLVGHPFALNLGITTTFSGSTQRNIRLDADLKIFGPTRAEFPVPEPTSVALWRFC